MRSYQDLKRILELWEQGHNKLQISKMTGISRWTVMDSINRYGSVEQLDAFMAGASLPTLDETAQEQRRYAITFVPKLRNYTDDELIKAVAESFSLAEVLRKFDIRPAGGNYDTVKRRIAGLKLDTSHFTGKNWSKGKKSRAVRLRPWEDILVENSTYMSTAHLRERLLREGVFPHRCVSCGLSEWLERPIPLEIDHVNGDRRDNRLGILRLLCPNCHALTDTYRGKNKRGSAIDVQSVTK
jgi:hypothetical protein